MSVNTRVSLKKPQERSMARKVCTTCKELLDLSEFNKKTGTPDDLTYECKSCSNLRLLVYKRTKEGLVATLYNTQKQVSKRRKHDKPDYTKEELQAWLYNQEEFSILYDSWVNSGYTSDDKPSCDRTDDYMPYTLDNLQVMTWKENKEKGHKDRKAGVNKKVSKSVEQYTLDDVFVKEYVSTHDASRQTGFNRGNIASACRGVVKTCSKYKWKYK